jgi:hypothetical protein
MSTGIKHERGIGTFLAGGPGLAQWRDDLKARGLHYLPLFVEGEQVGLQPVEIFHHPRDYRLTTEEGEPLECGWYWWPVHPGCLPDGDPMGPYDTSAFALAEALKEYET